MINTSDFNVFDNQASFDFKGFLLRIASQWKLFLIAWIIAFSIAYQVNIRKEKIYALDTTIALKEQTNPFFTANTSLTFNWGGSSDAVQSITSTLTSRSHNELVVEKLSFYINYLRQDKYNIVDAYGQVPFFVKIDKSKGQLLGQNIKIKFLTEKIYQIEILFEAKRVSVIHYQDNSITSTTVHPNIFTKNFKIGEKVDLPFLHWTLELQDNPGFYKGSEFLVSFSDFDGSVGQYKGISVESDAKGGSLLKLSMQGTNKARLVTYLNTTVNVLKTNQLAIKNQFATNTIAFIDSTLIAMESQIKDNAAELKSFTKGKNIYAIEEGGAQVSQQLLEFDVKKDEVARKLNYYNGLKKYLNSSVDFSRLPAPSVAGIEDPNIVINVSKLISLSAERSALAYAVKSEKIFKDFDNQMNAIKNVLIENISTAKQSLQYELNMIGGQISQSEANIKKLPQDQQELMKIQRKYDLNDNIYNTFMSKKSEADIVRAANLSDVHFIDTAKDTGGGLIGPNESVNYIIAFFMGLLVPLIFMFLVFFANNTIHKIEEINSLTKIPVIGIVGKKSGESNLAVFEKPKSALSESFRAIRSSLQFLYRKQNVDGSKVLMITSSVGGEGKTFCSVNIATVFAMSEKKTIIIGMDLRKPKLFDDFKTTNDVGLVNFLIGQKSIADIVQKTHIPNLEIITSGPIPPNPSELIMSEAMAGLIKDLKTMYDYVILDTPPVGLVSDALEIADFADLTLYIVRQNYTTKDMITVLNNRTKRDELKNVSIVVNGFESKAKFGYGYGYGYGYGNYSNGYLDDDSATKSWFDKAVKFIKQKIQ